MLFFVCAMASEIYRTYRFGCEETKTGPEYTWFSDFRLEFLPFYIKRNNSNISSIFQIRR